MNYKQFFGAALAALMIVIVIFMLAPGAWAQSKYKTLHKFGGLYQNDGGNPGAGLIFDQVGNLYGTTEDGGGGNSGTVFELTPNADGSWTESLLYSSGGNPQASLIFDQVGNLYSTEFSGGDQFDGAVFEMTPNGDGSWTESTLYSFCQLRRCKDGEYPWSALVFDQRGNLYGTTQFGGKYGFGVVFELIPNPDGTWAEKVLYSFNDKGGAAPAAGLIFDAKGNLYGTAAGGGAHGDGVAFMLTPNPDGSWKHKVLHHFTAGEDGGGPVAGLIFDTAGNLYGTTSGGGVHGAGVIFELTPNPNGSWKEKVLHQFTGAKDGSSPQAGVILDQAGNLYGTTTYGGAADCDCGLAFKLSPNPGGGWNETVLHRFSNVVVGGYPVAGLIFDAAGNLYGTTCGYGDDGVCAWLGSYGSVFEITP